jgi:hypothetical protein
MLARFNKLIGNRTNLPNEANDSAEILAWHHPLYTPAYHLALQVRLGNTVEYLSLSPGVHPNFSGSKLFDLRRGYDAYFVRCYEEELLIQGVRAAWPELKNTLNEKQQAMLTDDTLKKLTDHEILELANEFPIAKQNEIRVKGNPTHVVQLRSLDLAAMIAEIKALKAPEAQTKWALWSGTALHEDKAYNCASAVQRVLSAGGLEKLTTASRDLAGYAGALLGAIYAYSNNQSWQTAMKNIILATLVARGVQSACEGYTGIQRYLNFNAGKSQDNQSAALGLRLLSVTLSGFIGAILPEPILPKIVCMPGDTLALVQEAKDEEDSRFKPLHVHASGSPQNH